MESPSCTTDKLAAMGVTEHRHAFCVFIGGFLTWFCSPKVLVPVAAIAIALVRRCRQLGIRENDMDSATTTEGTSSRSLYLQLLLGAAFLFYIARPIVFAVTDPLRKVPGPFAARFTKLWLARQYVKGDFHRTNRRLHAKYGAWSFIVARWREN